MTSTQFCALTRTANRAPQSLSLAVATSLGRLASLLERHRRTRESEALLAGFNDRMLADIGLRRDRIEPGTARADLMVSRFGGF